MLFDLAIGFPFGVLVGKARIALYMGRYTLCPCPKPNRPPGAIIRVVGLLRRNLFPVLPSVKWELLSFLELLFHLFLARLKLRIAAPMAFPCPAVSRGGMPYN